MVRGKGGGPKTAEGKAIASRNATAHGLRSDSPVVREFESEEEWEAFAAAVVEDLRPEGAVQWEIARRVAELKWRMRRISRYETAEAKSNFYMAKDDFKVYIMTLPDEEFTRDPKPEHMAVLNRMMARRAVPNEAAMQRVARYEAHLSRQLYRALWELRLLQKYREEGPAAVWVEVKKG